MRPPPLSYVRYIRMVPPPSSGFLEERHEWNCFGRNGSLRLYICMCTYYHLGGGGGYICYIGGGGSERQTCS